MENTNRLEVSADLGNLWELNGTIHEYAYLTHNFFRYYGKFPSALAKRVINEFIETNGPANIIDNYSGSGTTLVEAVIAGHNAIGVDINPLGVLAANVKTTFLPAQALEDACRKILLVAKDFLESGEAEIAIDHLPMEELEKWFSLQATLELCALRHAIYGFESGTIKDFYLLAFASIIRRVSRAYDGEVRPHINKGKAPRSPLEVFEKKSLDMCQRMKEFGVAVKGEATAACYLGDNRALIKSSEFASESFDLALTHPPYVNCFDYLPVYRLELLWLDGLFNQWSVQSRNLLGSDYLDYKQLRKLETRSWPANPQVIESYRIGNLQMLEGLWQLLRPGAMCCVVIGDSTIKGELLPVHRWFIEMGEMAGFRHKQTIYRTTHYGTGKYAYKNRADYHGKAEKRDAILVFNKPKSG
nr:site-specific DNA-methyltransferase [Ancylothrix sp. D3o]